MVVGEVARPVQTLVIGGGPGGYTAAARAAELGQEVVLVEAGALGGVCLNVGCIPSKALIAASRDVERIRAAAAWGIRADPVVDFAATQRWKQGIVDELVTGVRQLLAKVEVVTGFARFLDPHRVAVESDEGVAHFRFDSVILATGSRPLALPDLPVDGDRVLDSTGALALPEVPATLAVVGGGYIGVELGIAYARLGARVTIIEALDRLLPGFDADLVKEVERGVERLGIEVRTNTPATEQATGHPRAEKVLVAVGRRPNTDDLQLEEAGLTVSGPGHLEVDERQRTAVDGIYAIGDITRGPALAHKAMAEGRVAAEVIAGLPAAFDQVVPLIAFTDPELASVGLTEQQARDEGYEVLLGRASFRANGRAATVDERRGLVKLVADGDSQTILGVHLAGPDATDLVGEAALAVETAARLEDVAATVHPHPTLTEVLGDAATAALRRRERAARR